MPGLERSVTEIIKSEEKNMNKIVWIILPVFGFAFLWNILNSDLAGYLGAAYLILIGVGYFVNLKR